MRPEAAGAVEAVVGGRGGSPAGTARGRTGEELPEIARRMQDEVSSLIREQLADTAATTQRLMACTSLPAAVSIQIEATVRGIGRAVARGQAVAGLGREALRSLAAHRRINQ